MSILLVIAVASKHGCLLVPPLAAGNFAAALLCHFFSFRGLMFHLMQMYWGMSQKTCIFPILLVGLSQDVFERQLKVDLGPFFFFNLICFVINSNSASFVVRHEGSNLFFLYCVPDRSFSFTFVFDKFFILCLPNFFGL